MVPLIVHRFTGPPSEAEAEGWVAVPTGVQVGPAQLPPVKISKTFGVDVGWNITAAAEPPGKFTLAPESAAFTMVKASLASVIATVTLPPWKLESETVCNDAAPATLLPSSP